MRIVFHVDRDALNEKGINETEDVGNQLEIEIDWNLPVIPIKDDLISFDSFLTDEQKELVNTGLCFTIYSIDWRKDEIGIYPQIFLDVE